MIAVEDHCPGCGAEVTYELEQVVPSLTSLGEPPNVYVRYLSRMVNRRPKTVHKCSEYLPDMPPEEKG